jgi:hypothetical protein
MKFPWWTSGGAILERFQLPSFTQTIGVSYCRAAQGDMPKFLV